MHRLHVLARLVLAWYVLVVAVAAGMPLVQAQGMDLVCTGGAMKLVAADGGEDGRPPTMAGFDCPLCAAAAPPPPRSVAWPAAQPLGRAVQPIPSARLAALPGAALPPRGPPALS